MTFEKVCSILRYRKIKKAKFEVIEQMLNAEFERLNPDADGDLHQCSLEDNKITAIKFAARFNGQPDPFIRKKEPSSPIVLAEEIPKVKAWINELELSQGQIYTKQQIQSFVRIMYLAADADRVFQGLG